jgi:hypothetical protein
MIRVGGGYVAVEEFLRKYAAAEARKKLKNGKRLILRHLTCRMSSTCLMSNDY